MSDSPNDGKQPNFAADESGEMTLPEAYHKWLGISPEEQPVNYYRLLGIGLSETDPDVIANASDRQMSHVKTLQTGKHSDLSQKILNRIAAARVTLLNKERKTAYDATLRGSQQGQPAAATARAESRPTADQRGRVGSTKPENDSLEFLSAVAPAAQRSRPPAKRPSNAPSMAVIVGAAGAVLVVFAVVIAYMSDDGGTPPQQNNSQARAGGAAPVASSGGRPNGAGATGARVPAPRVDGGSGRFVQPPNFPWSGEQGQGEKPGGPNPHASPGSNSPDGASPTTPRQSAPPTTDTPPTLADVIERAEKSVVRVNVKGEEFTATGSGFAVGDGAMIVTNYHVIDGAQSANVEFQDGTIMKVVGYVGIQPKRDIAILRVTTLALDSRPPIKLAVHLPRQGETVCSIGAPEGFSFSVANGIVSAIRTGNELVQLKEVPAASFIAGYDNDVTWVQTTAPISHGNSGGPLVSAAGEVVGMNTWSRTDGQNLNFAVSAIDIQKSLDQCRADVTPLSSLPRRPKSAVVESNDRIQMPSGKVLDVKVLFMDGLAGVVNINGSSNDLFGKSVVAEFKFDSGKPFVWAAEDRGKLNGPVLALFETTGKPTMFGTYLDNSRHGNLLTWTELGKRLLFAQFSKGKRNGFLCLFNDSDQLWLVEEYERDKVLSSHLLQGGAVVKSYGPPNADGLPPDPVMAEATSKRDEVWAKMKENELKLKKAVDNWDEVNIRRPLAAAHSAEARENIIDRANSRRADRADAIGTLRALSKGP